MRKLGPYRRPVMPCVKAVVGCRGLVEHGLALAGKTPVDGGAGVGRHGLELVSVCCPEDAGEQLAEQQSHAGKAGADDTNVDFDTGPDAKIDNVLCFGLVVCPCIILVKWRRTGWVLGPGKGGNGLESDQADNHDTVKGLVVFSAR